MNTPSPAPDPSPLPPAYTGYFDCFNSGRFFEAHDVLEELWLDCRLAPEGDFFKALIQFAGVFVHLEKQRRGPAAGLCRLALKYLHRYPTPFMSLDTDQVRATIRGVLARIEAGVAFAELLAPAALPKLAPKLRG
jgi:predicted metal-dependent hydrolase